MIDDFEHFLRMTKENGNNAAVKYIRYLNKQYFGYFLRIC